MRKILHTTVLIAALAGGLARPSFASDDAFLGALGGAALGGFIGNQFGRDSARVGATILGSVAGGYIGSRLVYAMERSNRPYHGRLKYDLYNYGNYGASPYRDLYGRERPYSVPGDDYRPNYVAPPSPPPPHYVAIDMDYVPLRPDMVVDIRYMQPVAVKGGYVGAGLHCRRFTQSERHGKEVREISGTACLQPDGSWQVER
jgi:surface antigen